MRAYRGRSAYDEGFVSGGEIIPDTLLEIRLQNHRIGRHWRGLVGEGRESCGR
jgi:hypothetical protein